MPGYSKVRKKSKAMKKKGMGKKFKKK